MSPSRLLPLWLLTAALAASACSTDTTDPGGTLDGGDGDGGNPWMGQDASSGDGDMMMGDGDQPGDGDGDMPDGGDGDNPDAGPDACIPLGCAELGYTCGMAKDNCGGDLNCEPTSGEPCTGFDTCGGDATKPNQCGCTPKTCEDLGAACGTDLADGCGATLDCGAGSCHASGTNWACKEDLSGCECFPLPKNTACDAKGILCGTASNGCDGTTECGGCASGMTCQEEQDGSAACVCDTSEEARAAACGDRTCGTAPGAEGCGAFTCGNPPKLSCDGALCAEDGACTNCNCQGGQVCHAGFCKNKKTKAEACETQKCGTASDGVGGFYTCGACDGEDVCLTDTTYLDPPVPTCVSPREKSLLGKYLVRTHSFRDSNSSEISRAETISIVTIEKVDRTRVVMKDVGCVATTIENGGRSLRTVLPFYFNAPPVIVDLDLSDAQHDWVRDFKSETAGFISARPNNYYCSEAGALLSESASVSHADFDAQPNDGYASITPSSGVAKKWLNDAECTCPPNGSDYSALPTPNVTSSVANIKDCRINDYDGDNRPGFTMFAALGATTIDATAVTFSTTRWHGNVREDRRHTGRGVAKLPENTPVGRSILSCQAKNYIILNPCNSLSAPVDDWYCAEKYDLIQFVPLAANELPDGCATFYDFTQEYSSSAYVKQTAIDSWFSLVPGSSCTQNTDCEDGEICKQNACIPMTTPNACADGGTCPTADGWTCGAGRACWPSSCPKPAP